MTYHFIQYKKQSQICYITLNRIEKRNAFNERLIEELKYAFEKAQNDSSIRVVILNANGDVFSAGADLEYLQSLQTNSYEENLADSKNLKELYQQIYSFPKIVIAQVEGHAIAGGCGLATVCDFTFTIPAVKFGYTEVKIGFVPAIVMVFLLKKVGELHTKDLLLTGKLISSETAKEIGLINSIFSKDNIKQEVFKFATKLCKETSSQSIQQTKEMLLKIQKMDYKEAFDHAAEINAKARATDDCKKGISAFLNKEKIVW